MINCLEVTPLSFPILNYALRLIDPFLIDPLNSPFPIFQTASFHLLHPVGGRRMQNSRFFVPNKVGEGKGKGRRCLRSRVSVSYSIPFQQQNRFVMASHPSLLRRPLASFCFLHFPLLFLRLPIVDATKQQFASADHLFHFRSFALPPL